MKKNIIKCSGAAFDVARNLEILRAIFGGGTTLATVAEIIKKNKLKNIIDNQMKNL